MKKLLLIFAAIYSLNSAAQPFSNNYIVCDTISQEDSLYQFIKLDTSSTNIWQRGNPNKAFFTSALSGSYSLVTDTANTYSSNNKSVFIFNWLDAISNDCYNLGGLTLAFVHSLNTDSLAGGYIEISTDSINWKNIFDADLSWGGYTAGINKVNTFENPPFGGVLNFQPDTLFNGELGFTGNAVSDTFFLYFNWNLVFREFYSPILRFTFISDSLSSPNDGWMIDDIVLGSYETYGSVSESLSKAITLYPNPANDKLAFSFDENKFNPTELTITNVVGQKVFTGPFQKTLNISTLQQGVYYVTISDAKGNAAAKMFYKQ